MLTPRQFSYLLNGPGVNEKKADVLRAFDGPASGSQGTAFSGFAAGRLTFWVSDKGIACCALICPIDFRE